MENYTLLEIKTPRTGEESLESMVQFLASLSSIKSKKTFFSTIHSPIFLEIANFNQSIHFYIAVPEGYQVFIESQILSQFPRSLITVQKKNPLEEYLAETDADLQIANLKLTQTDFYPLKTFREFKEIDSLSPLLGMLSKLNREDVVLIQYLLIPAGNSWQKQGQKYIENRNKVEGEDPLNLAIYSKQVAEKISSPGFHTSIRLMVKSSNPSLINLVSASYASFNMINGNSLQTTEPAFWQRNKFIRSMLNRTLYLGSNQILNTSELATLYHFPGKSLATLTSINWSQTILSDAPDNLPVAEDLTDEEKRNINFFARTDYKNKSAIFGVKRVDRSKHVYIIGKTGTGKSTLIANMVINDIRNGEGVAIIDPHGDLSEIILDYIPSHRVNDVVYFNPGDTEHAMHLNPLQIDNKGQKELVASGIVSIFYKLYANSWGPRLEYILRNTILTLLEVPDATLLQVPELLTNSTYRRKVVETLTDPVVKSYWLNEFEKMSDSMRNEAISPILNKVGQFLSSSLIRNIVGYPKSTIDLEDIMNNGKILIMNVSQGKIGEDNAALLGAMIITKLQLAAMNRVHMIEADRRDFYLYVDEFQNFATGSFIKILSEARKYHLNLSLANQYTAQIPPEIRSAIFGNAGTIISFLVGAEDAPILAREFGSRYTTDDLLALGNFQMLLKMSISNVTCAPFFAGSLPLPQSKTQNKEKVLRVSTERYAKRVEDLEVRKVEPNPPTPPNPSNSSNRSYSSNPSNSSHSNAPQNRDRNNSNSDRNKGNQEGRKQNWNDQKKNDHHSDKKEEHRSEERRQEPPPNPHEPEPVEGHPPTPLMKEQAIEFNQNTSNDSNHQGEYINNSIGTSDAPPTQSTENREPTFDAESDSTVSPFLATPPSESQIVYQTMEPIIDNSIEEKIVPDLPNPSNPYTPPISPPTFLEPKQDEIPQQQPEDPTQIKSLPQDDDSKYPKTAEDLIKILSGNKE